MAEAEAAQARTKRREQENALKDNARELESLRKHVATYEQERAQLERDLSDSKDRAQALKLMQQRRQQAPSRVEPTLGWLAVFGLSMMLLGGALAGVRDRGGASFALGLGLICAAPWAFKRLGR